MRIRKSRSWELPDSAVTSETDYLRRRDFLLTVGLGVAATVLSPAAIRAATAGFPDVLDPAFAPGVSHREPGGMSVREALDHLHSITATIVGADIVEYNPSRDVSDLTATVAGKILKELIGKMLMACNCP